MDGETSLRLRRTRACLRRRLALAKHLGIHLQRLGEALERLGAQENEPSLSREVQDSLLADTSKALMQGPLGPLLEAIIEAKYEEAWLLAVLERQELIRCHIQRAMQNKERSFQATCGGRE